MAITIRVERAEEVTRDLKGMLRKLTPAFKDIAIDIRQRNARAFETGGFGSWAPLASSTIATRRFPGLPILVQTGMLRDSYTTRAYERVSSLGVEVGSSDPKAPYHEFGTQMMPARPVLDTGGADERRWVGVIERKINELKP